MNYICSLVIENVICYRVNLQSYWVMVYDFRNIFVTGWAERLCRSDVNELLKLLLSKLLLIKYDYT